MTMKKLLGISLALVMLIGSVPLGFSESLRVQLEQGMEIDQLQCNNPDHVLVLRTNGKLACVTEKMSERLGWEIQNKVSQITYDDDFGEFFIQNSNQNSNSAPKPFAIMVEAMISKIPEVGDTFDVTITGNLVHIFSTNSMSTHFGVGFTDNLEFVSGDMGFVREAIFETGLRELFYASDETSLLVDQPQSMTVTLKVIKSGLTKIRASIGEGTSFVLDIKDVNSEIAINGTSRYNDLRHEPIISIQSIDDDKPSMPSPQVKQCEIDNREKYKDLPPFVDRCIEDLQYYVDLYENTLVFREWFDLVYPDMTIEQSLELEDSSVSAQSMEQQTISSPIFLSGYLFNTSPYVPQVQEPVPDILICVWEELDDGSLIPVTLEGSDEFACNITYRYN